MLDASIWLHSKGYRLYDVERMKVVHSRDVVFDETSTPRLQKETTVKYVCGIGSRW